MKNIIIEKTLKLDCGKEISNFPLAYETYGNLNEKKDNAILIFHALTGDQYASGINPITKKEGWWNYADGPGKSFDTDKFFVICANVIGGCMGSYGPGTIDPLTNKPIGTNFPVITEVKLDLEEDTNVKYLSSINPFPLGSKPLQPAPGIYNSAQACKSNSVGNGSSK